MRKTDFLKMKNQGEKIIFLTAYDYWTARILNDSPVHGLLVGDSLSMVMHGESSTVKATMDQLVMHTQAVVKGAPDRFVVADLPFLSYHGSMDQCLGNVDRLMKAGAQAVKLEGCIGHEKRIEAIINGGVPVMGHLGLTPQSVHQLGGYKIQGRKEDSAKKLLKEAQILEELGCFSVVLECVPSDLGQEISETLSIPTIGIGAGPKTDGQIMVLQDFMGAFDKNAKFVRPYMNIQKLMKDAISNFAEDIHGGNFPGKEESYE